MSLALGKNSVNAKQPLHLDSTNHLLVNDSTNKAVLETIATNTANINVNVGDVEINVADLEALQATTNTTLASILVDTDACDSSLNTIEAQSVLTASILNNIQNKISANVDGTGDKLGQINSNILTKNGEIESSLNSLISANHTDLLALETTLTEIATDGNNVQTKLDTIDGSINTLEACVGSNKVNVNIASGSMSLASGASTEAKQDDIESSLNSLIARSEERRVGEECRSRWSLYH